jgi:diphthamide synthase (EF-2-diphthine--ammonia ligase)
MRVALAWGCGIGSLLALDALLREGHDVTLVHAPPPAGALRAVPPFVVQEQAARLGLPLRLARGPDERSALAEAAAGFDAAAFGYLRGEEHEGAFKLGRALPTRLLLPVRHERPDEAARALARAGHRLFVRAVAAPLPRDLLGRFLDEVLIDEIEGAHGRRGWALVRTLAVDGPRFETRLDVAAGEPEPVESRGKDRANCDSPSRGCPRPFGPAGTASPPEAGGPRGTSRGPQDTAEDGWRLGLSLLGC